MSIELKIKYKHLALEPAIIRKEEQKLLKQIAYNKKYYQVYDLEDHSVTRNLYTKWYSLKEHRKTVVRNEARATHLARAYIAGMSYYSVEGKCENKFLLKNTIFPRIFAMVAKYGDTPLKKYWNNDTKRMEFDPMDKQQLEEKILVWLGLNK